MSKNLPLVILPGVNSGAYLFAEAKKALPGRELIVFDPPGVMQVPLPLPFSVKAYAKQVVMELERRGVREVDILGHSMGSFAAQAVVRMLGNRVRRLILVSSSYGQPASARDIIALSRHTGKSFWQVMKQVEETPNEGMAWFFGPEYVRTNSRGYADFLKMRAKYLPGRAVSLAHLTAGGAFSSAGWVGTLTLPVLLIHGTEDYLVTVESGRELVAHLPNGRLLELLGVGHFPMLEHPQFYEYVQRFLDGEVMGDGLEKVMPPMWRKVMNIFRRS